MGEERERDGNRKGHTLREEDRDGIGQKETERWSRGTLTER